MRLSAVVGRPGGRPGRRQSSTRPRPTVLAPLGAARLGARRDDLGGGPRRRASGALGGASRRGSSGPEGRSVRCSAARDGSSERRSSGGSVDARAEAGDVGVRSGRGGARSDSRSAAGARQDTVVSHRGRDRRPRVRRRSLAFLGGDQGRRRRPPHGRGHPARGPSRGAASDRSRPRRCVGRPEPDRRRRPRRAPSGSGRRRRTRPGACSRSDGSPRSSRPGRPG